MPAQSILDHTHAAPTYDHALEELGIQSDAQGHAGSDSGSDSEIDTDSDSLDSQTSRKRRKTSPAHGRGENENEYDNGNGSDSDDDDTPHISIPVTSVPSRIKTNAKSRANGPGPQVNMGSILAPVDPQATFASLNVKPWLVNSLASMAIRRPTGIQKGCIPEILKGRDCIGGSRTGSGKTVAFAAPILQKWAEDPFGIFALVLTPTR